MNNMGILNRFGNMWTNQQTAMLSIAISNHQTKNCKHCNIVLQDDMPLEEFIDHLEKEHKQDISMEDGEIYEKYKKYIGK